MRPRTGAQRRSADAGFVSRPTDGSGDRRSTMRAWPICNACPLLSQPACTWRESAWRGRMTDPAQRVPVAAEGPPQEVQDRREQPGQAPAQPVCHRGAGRASARDRALHAAARSDADPARYAGRSAARARCCLAWRRRCLGCRFIRCAAPVPAPAPITSTACGCRSSFTCSSAAASCMASWSTR